MMSGGTSKSMPVGYRFHPTDQELVNYYLRLKNEGSDRQVANIPEIDVCKWEPWELPVRLGSVSEDQEWYFFGRRDSKYGKSTTRSNRATKEGYWKPTGKDRYIKASGSKKVIGTKKTLVFYRGRAQKAVRTYWVMHEYRASVDKHNHQAFVLYLLKKKTEEIPEISNASSPSASLLINTAAPPYSPSTPTVHQGSANFSSSDQTRINQNWKEQEVSSRVNASPAGSPYLEDDIDLGAFESCFDGHQATWEGLERMFPPIPLADVYANQGPINVTARYIDVSNNHHRVPHFQNLKMQDEVVNHDVSPIFMRTPEPVPLDAESGTETDDEVPQSLFEEDAVYGGSAYLSNSESSDAEFYNDMILAHKVSLSANNSSITRTFEPEQQTGKSESSLAEARGSAVNNSRTESELPLREPPPETAAQLSSNKRSFVVPSYVLQGGTTEAGFDKSTVDSLREASTEKPYQGHGLQLKCKANGFVVSAANPRENDGSTPLNYIINVAVGICVTIVIAGEVLFGLVR